MCCDTFSKGWNKNGRKRKVLCYYSLSLGRLIENTNDLLGTHITVIASLVLHDISSTISLFFGKSISFCWFICIITLHGKPFRFLWAWFIQVNTVTITDFNCKTVKRRTGKHKLRAWAVKYKFRAGAVKCKLGPGNTNTLQNHLISWTFFWDFGKIYPFS